MSNKKSALVRLTVRLGSDVLSLGGDKYPEIIAAQRIVAELAKVRMTSPMLLFNRPAADESVKAVDRCLEIAEEWADNGK